MDQKAIPEYEMNNLRNPSSTASLLEPKSAWKTRSETPQQSSKFHDFLRHVRLLLPITLFSYCVGWRSPKEQPKIAAYKSWQMAALNSLLHSIPLGGATILLVLYWKKTWIGGDTDNATALQFAAKFLELAMQASLVDILLYLIRSQATNSYLPLGALSGAAQAPQLSYLWSLDFVSAVRSPTLKLSHRAIFALSMVVLFCMTAVVGPSAAVLLIPRPGMPYLNNTILHYTNASEPSAYPSAIDQYFRLDLSQSRNMIDWNTIAESRLPNDYFLSTDMDPEPTSLRKVGYSLYQRPDKTKRQITVVTVATVQASWLLTWDSPANGSKPADNVTMTMQAPQPIVFSSCWYGSLTESVGYYYLYYLNNGPRRPFTNPRIVYEELILGNVAIENSNRSHFPPLWMPVPEDPQSLLAIIPKHLELALCTVSPFWWTATTSFSLVNGQELIRPEIPGFFEDMEKERMRPITISPEILSAPNSSCVQNTTNLVPLWLAGCFGAALSTLPDLYIDDEINSLYLYLANGTDINSELNGPTPSITFQVDVIKYGYGYGSANILSTLAVTVMTAYCLITILYVCYIITTGHTSIAWNSPIELIMLALQSKDPGDLGHVSVGLNSMETFRKSVGVRVNTVRDDDTGETRERLELVFEHDEDTEKRGLTKVVRNRAY